MNNKETIIGNKLIAEFMGGKLKPFNSNVNYWEWTDKIYRPYNNALGENNLKFNSSWEWLMPVVEKIETGNYGVKTCRKVVEIYYDDSKELILKTKEDCRFNSLYKAVVEFVKWQNKNVE